jgi:hypothetical protein
MHIGPNTAALNYFNSFAMPNNVGQNEAPNYAG